LAVLRTNPDGAGIAQAIGPLKTLAGKDSPASQRLVIVTELKDPSQWCRGQAAHRVARKEIFEMTSAEPGGGGKVRVRRHL